MAAHTVMEDFYMDDVLTGERICHKVVKLQRQLFELLQKGQFVLKKWRSNETRILKMLPNKRADDLLTIDKDAAKELGLLWNSASDILQIYNTKRNCRNRTQLRKGQC
jgi:hypothetical protein